MPATAGRVRMPANNRVHSSAALQTHGIWQSAIGYDPYAPANKESKPDNAAVENTYRSFQDLLSLARIVSNGSNETRGACKKCGRIGHLTYQCRNFLSLKDDGKPAAKNDDSALRKANEAFEEMKKAAGGAKAKEETEGEEEEDDVSSTSDSDVDPEIERIIAERYGKPMSKKVAALSKECKHDDGDDEERRKRRKHRHKKKRSSHRHHRRNSSRSSDDESDSDTNKRHKRRRRRRRSESSDSDGSSESERHRRQRPHEERRSVLSSESEITASSSDEDERRKRREKRWRKGHKRGGKELLK